MASFSNRLPNFPRLEIPLPEPKGNITAGTLTRIPANILEAFIPGFSLISRFLYEVFGFDVTILVSISLIFIGLFTSLRFLYGHVAELFRTYCMSSVSVESDDEIWEHVMDWLGEQKVCKENTSLMAKTGHYTWDTDDVDEHRLFDPDPSKLLNFSNWDSKLPPKYQPYFGKHGFWHRGTYFVLNRETKPMMRQSGWGSIVRDEETIKLSCIGRSTQPIKQLIQECQDRYFSKKTSRTDVRRPARKEARAMGRAWIRVAKRPSRPMDTVVLDHDQKEKVLADINEYLHPSSPRWYANRGIPYRRGYLFHGKPGTGKTSLSFAIAGIFGLDIYCISLLEPTLTEEDLGMLFNHLPRRCVVLLEDIDSAGLVRRDEAPKSSTQDDNEAKEGEGKIGTEIAKAFKSVQDQSKAKDKTQGISLSGLLNAIDGVASHEGRVLLLTTNFVEKLDDALIRPGRVDMTVAFTLASRNQIRQLFIRMYSPDACDGPAKESSMSPPPAVSIVPSINTAAADISLKPPLLPPQDHRSLTPPPTPTPYLASPASSTPATHTPSHSPSSSSSTSTSGAEAKPDASSIQVTTPPPSPRSQTPSPRRCPKTHSRRRRSRAFCSHARRSHCARWPRWRSGETTCWRRRGSVAKRLRAKKRWRRKRDDLTLEIRHRGEQVR